MPERTRVAPVVLLAVLLVALLSGCGGQDAAPEEPPRSTSSASATAAAPTSPATERAAAPPRRVTIPARVGWFTGGGKPGETWPVVIAGHKDSRTGPAVFARLTELQVGQQVSVVDTRNQRRTYEITEVRDVPQDGRFPTDDVYGETGDSQLRLITCTGPYDRGVGRYTENRVVFAEEV